MKKLIITSIVFSSFIMTSCIPLVAVAGAGYFGKDYKKTRKYLTNAKAIYDIIKNRADVRTAVMETRCVAVEVNTGNILVDRTINNGIVKLLALGFSNKDSSGMLSNSKSSKQKKYSNSLKKKSKFSRLAYNKKNLALKNTKEIDKKSNKNTSTKATNSNSSMSFKICGSSCDCERYVLIKLEIEKDKFSKGSITYLSFSIIKKITKLEL